MNKHLVSICVCAATLQVACATTWEPTTRECSLAFPDAGWTFQEGGAVPHGHMILAALNRDKTKSINLLSVSAPRSMSVQDPRYATDFKNGFAASGSRPLNDGYTNLNGRIAYWLTGEKNTWAGRGHVSTSDSAEKVG